MTDPNAVQAEFGEHRWPGRLSALEGGGGYMRVLLPAGTLLAEGQSGVLQMHDGARFRVVVIAPLDAVDDQAEFRVKLSGRDRGG